MENKVIWVTGASSGIGLSLIEKLCKEKSIIIATSSTKKKLEKIVTEDNKPYVHLEPGDLSNPDMCQVIADKIVKKFGRIDVLVNNAGINITDRLLRDLNPAGIDTLIDGNLKSMFYTSLSVLPSMRRQRYGLLIHLSSWTARWNLKVSGAGYSSAKSGIVSLSTSINQEEHHNGIRSSVLFPAEVNTPMLNARKEQLSAKEKNKMLTSSHVADAIAYIASTPPNVVINEMVISSIHNRYYD